MREAIGAALLALGLGCGGGPGGGGPGGGSGGDDPPSCVTALSAQGNLSCYLRKDGALTCAGQGGYGMLGNGMMEVKSAGTRVALDTVSRVAVGTGGDHVCAISRDDLYCWGEGGFSKLGNGGTTTATPFRALTGVAQVGPGFTHTCAVDSRGQLYCWGDGSSGKLGVGGGLRITDPSKGLVPLTDVVQVGGGSDHTCALRKDGTVWCWGLNQLGQLGQGSSGGSPPGPAQVMGLGGVTALAVGRNHSCAITTDRSLYCWGEGRFGKLGNGTTDNRPAPVKVPLSSVSSVAASYDNSCAVTADGAAYCWGANGSGQLGDAALPEQPMPTRVRLPGGALEIGAALQHACARLASGSLWCWGANNFYQLGNSQTATQAPVRTPVTCP